MGSAPRRGEGERQREGGQREFRSRRRPNDTAAAARAETEMLPFSFFSFHGPEAVLSFFWSLRLEGAARARASSLSQQRKGYLPKALLKPRHSGAGRASEHRSCCSRETNPKIRRRVRAHALCVLRFPPSRPSRPREEYRALSTSERATRARKVSEQAKQKKRKSEANRSRGKKGEKDFALDEKKHKSLFFLSFTARTS